MSTSNRYRVIPLAAGEQPPRPTISRLIEVELRKVTLTRAGFWLSIATLLIATAGAISTLRSGQQSGRTLDLTFDVVSSALTMLSPILGVLAVTSEWSQRTTLTALCLSPDRNRVILAKAGSVVLIALILLIFSVIVSYTVYAVGGSLDLTAGTWNLSATAIAQALLFQLVNMTIGFALGLLILNSAIATVLFLILPNVVPLLSEVPALRTAAIWVSPLEALAPLLATGVTGREWSQILTVSLIWIVIPLLAGFTRLAQHDLTA